MKDRRMITVQFPVVTVIIKCAQLNSLFFSLWIHRDINWHHLSWSVGVHKIGGTCSVCLKKLGLNQSTGLRLLFRTNNNRFWHFIYRVEPDKVAHQTTAIYPLGVLIIVISEIPFYLTASLRALFMKKTTWAPMSPMYIQTWQTSFSALSTSYTTTMIVRLTWWFLLIPATINPNGTILKRNFLPTWKLILF